jgi:DUF1680 family protein
MKKTIIFILGLWMHTAFSQDYPYQPVAFTNVKLTDNFWLPRIKINNSITIPTSFERCDKTGRIKNFEMAAARSGKFCTIFPFDDTDIYKIIEGASFSLSLFPDKKLESYLDSLITIIGKAQEADGYLYTARTIDPLHPHSWSGLQRWEKEREGSHELYNSGHLYEAAAAHFIATGKRNLLNIALKNADLVCSVFHENGLHIAPGHEVVEMGLVKLYRITGEKKYLNTAKFFIEQRGYHQTYDSKSNDPWRNGSYWQDNIPVVQQKEAEGHVVRAGYLYAAVADVAALTGDKDLLTAIDSIWNNFVSKKIYVQGGAGAVSNGERYGDNYELPNANAYNETCAAIANIYWNQRMFQLHGNAQYIDVLEKILYNGFISGVGLDGKSFFYTNAMQVKNHPQYLFTGEAERSGWFDCSCCPTNVTRMLPAIPGYVYATDGNNFFINLFVNSQSTIDLQGKKISITQQNNYPWDGNLKFIINPQKNNTFFSAHIRIPGWARNIAIPSDLYAFENNSSDQIIIKLNGKPAAYIMENGYAVLNRQWKKSDVIEIILPMEIKRIVANKNLKDDIGKVALQRGPIIYCAEWIDNNNSVSNLLLTNNSIFTTEYKPNFLNGVTVLKTEAPVIAINKNTVNTHLQPFVAIPYYAWANRGKGEMQIWLPEKITDIAILTN